MVAAATLAASKLMAVCIFIPCLAAFSGAPFLPTSLQACSRRDGAQTKARNCLFHLLQMEDARMHKTRGRDHKEKNLFCAVIVRNPVMHAGFLLRKHCLVCSVMVVPEHVHGQNRLLCLHILTPRHITGCSWWSTGPDTSAGPGGLTALRCSAENETMSRAKEPPARTPLLSCPSSHHSCTSSRPFVLSFS